MVLPLKPGVGQYTAIHAAGISSLLISNLLVHSSAFFPNLSQVFHVLAVANTSSCEGPQSKISHPAHHYSELMQVPMLSARRI